MKQFLGTVAAASLLTASIYTPVAASEHIMRADSVRNITFNACPQFRLSAQGDGDTDLDFALYNPAGLLIYSDYDNTDWTSALVSDGDCGTYRLRVINYGDVWNALNVSVRPLN